MGGVSVNSGPFVSVVVPVHNGERYLRAALESVFAQDYRPFEVIVIDDGSTDQSAAVARTFPAVRYVYQENAGVAAARNAGIAPAAGDLIAFLDQDDWWAPNKLRLQVSALRDHPEAGFALAREEVYLEPGIGWPSWIRREAVLNGAVIGLPGGWLVRREVFDRIGAFNPDYVMGCDTEWLIRARDAGIKPVVVPEVLLFWRIHVANASYNHAQGQAEFFRILKATMDRKRQGLPAVAATSAQPVRSPGEPGDMPATAPRGASRKTGET
jgi:glycosyltransferase involved in cell wall biosynthesis